MKIIIIGAGASGLTSAIKLSEKHEVVVLEKNNISGKKLLITGNGKCNYYNDLHDIKKYHSSFENLLAFIKDEDYKKILDLFDNIGIVPEIKDGYYYPKSNQATSVKNALELEAKIKGVNIIYNEEVLEVTKKENKFIVKTNNNNFNSDAIVIATGGKSFTKTGSDGKGYDFAKNFGHTIIKPLPGLVQLEAKDKINQASGVRCKAKLTLFEDNKEIAEERGELQITDYGISGICAMQLSSIISKKLDEGKEEVISINFLEEINDVHEWLINRNNILKNRTISQLLEGVLNYKLINVILKKSKIEQENYLEELKEDKINKLCENLTNYKLQITSTKGFDNAQVTVGGVSLDEVTSNFESKIVNNLFFTGEVLDVNGDCGGYNLMFAWISGLRVGEYLNDKVKTN